MFYYPISTLVSLTETREQWSRDTGGKGNLFKLVLTGGWWLKHPKESEITRTEEQSLLALMSQKSGISSSWTANEQSKKTTAPEILFFTRSITQLTGWMLALLVSVKNHLQHDQPLCWSSAWGQAACWAFPSALTILIWAMQEEWEPRSLLLTTESADYPTAGIGVTHYNS